MLLLQYILPRIPYKKTRPLLVFFISVVALTFNFPALATQAIPLHASNKIKTRFTFSIPVKPLDFALIDLASITNTTLLYPTGIIGTKSGNAVYGKMTVNRALSVLLKNTGLVARVSASGQFTIQKETNNTPISPNAGQETANVAEPAIEEVIVTGKLSASYRGSAAFKRASASIIDVATEEDIGKMPDENLVDTLQRLPGIQIERREGEGSLVRVRGLTNNIMLLNGERFASGMELFQIDDNRSFEGSLETVPHELLHRVEVYKTPQAHHPEGSIGGTIDLISRPAFDIADDFLTINLTQNTGEFSQNHDISRFIAWGKNWNNKIAMIGSISSNERSNKGESIELFSLGGYIEPGKKDMPLLSPRAGSEEARAQTRKRLGSSLRFQYKFNDAIELNAEWFSLSGKINTHRHAYQRNIPRRVQTMRDDSDKENPIDPDELSSPKSSKIVNFAIPADDKGTPGDVINTNLPLHFYSQRKITNTNERILSSGESAHVLSNNFHVDITYKPSNYWHVSATAKNLSASMQQRTGRIESLIGPFTSRRWVGERSPTGWKAVTLNNSGKPLESIYNTTLRPTFKYTYPAQRFRAENLSFADQYAFGADSDQNTFIGKFDAIYTLSHQRANVKFGLRLSNTNSQFDQLRYLFDFSKTVGAASPRLFDKNGIPRKETNFDKHDKPLPGEWNIGLREAVYYDLCGNGGLLAGKTCDIDQDGLDDNKPIGPYGHHTRHSDSHASTYLLTSSGKTFASELFGFDLDTIGLQSIPSYLPSASYLERADRYHIINAIFLTNNPSNSYVLPNLHIVTRNVGEWIDGIAPNTPVTLLKSPLDSWAADERTTAGYLEFNIVNNKLGYEINAGLRAVKTSIHVSSTNTDRTQLHSRITSEQNNFNIPLFVEPAFASNKYWNYLPSINAKWLFSDNFALRANASRTIARPLLQDLGPGFTPKSSPGELFFDINTIDEGKRGNSSLNPYRIRQYDLALEYYFSNNDFIIGNVFKKNIKQFIVNTTSLSFEFGKNAEGALISEPKNINIGNITGLELSAQKIWGNGFGFSANTTYIDSVSEASSFSNDQLPLPGISTYNLNVIAFYENRHIGIRLGYNQRSKYLSPFSKTIRISDFTMFNNQLGVPLALYHNGSKRLDARIFWHLDHRFSLHIDMLNITKESESGYLEFKDIPAFYKQDESRLAFGLKVNAF